jgi:hypothetical protein
MVLDPGELTQTKSASGTFEHLGHEVPVPMGAQAVDVLTHAGEPRLLLRVERTVLERSQVGRELRLILWGG